MMVFLSFMSLCVILRLRLVFSVDVYKLDFHQIFFLQISQETVQRHRLPAGPRLAG